MDVLQEIERKNGRAVSLLQHEHTTIGQERGRFYVRGFHYGNPGEVVSVYLTGEEVDRLTAERARGAPSAIEEQRATVDLIFSTLQTLRRHGRQR